MQSRWGVHTSAPTIPQWSHQACPCTCCSPNTQRTLCSSPSSCLQQQAGTGARKSTQEQGENKVAPAPICSPANQARCRCIFSDTGLFFFPGMFLRASQVEAPSWHWWHPAARSFTTVSTLPFLVTVVAPAAPLLLLWEHR